MGNINLLSENDWRIFVETGYVDKLIINKIALKVVFSIELTKREQAVRIEKSKEIEEILIKKFNKCQH